MSYFKRLKFIGLRFHVDPNQVAGGAGAGAGEGQPAPPAPKEDTLLEDFAWLQKNDPELLAEKFREIRGENGFKRKEAQQAKKDLEAERARAAALEQQLSELKRKELLEKENYKQAYEQSEAEKAQLVAAKDKALIDTALKSKALELGIDPKLLPLLNKNGIGVDGSGNVSGLEHAFSTMLDEHKEIIQALQKPGQQQAAAPGAGQQQQQQQQADPASDNPADKMFIPGTQQTYGDQRRMLNMANGGQAPPNRQQSKPAAKPDFSKMTAAEKEMWYKNWQAKNNPKGR